MNFLLGWPNFRGELLVSGMVFSMKSCDPTKLIEWFASMESIDLKTERLFECEIWAAAMEDSY